MVDPGSVSAVVTGAARLQLWWCPSEMGKKFDARTRDACKVGSCAHIVWSEAASVRSVTMARNGRVGAVGYG